MKLVIVLLAVVAAVHCHPGYYSEPVVADPWQAPAYHQPSVWPASAWQPHYPHYQPPIWKAPAWQPHYVKLAVPLHHQVHHAEVHHVVNVPQPPAVPALHPKPLALKVHDHPTRIHYAAPHVPHPHLIGYEAHVEEPAVKVVKHGW